MPNHIQPIDDECAKSGHDWIEMYDVEGDIVGRLCARCGRLEGRMQA